VARIVLAWELGGDYGHLGRLLPLALEFQRRGHQPLFVIRELAGAESLLQPHGLTWFQAPLWIGRVENLPEAAGYAEMLMRFGFLNPRALTGIARTWRHLFSTLAADMVVMDHAPTALLASRGLGLVRVNLGDGFCIPPATRPLPLFHWWQAGNAVRQADSEEKVRQVINEALVHLDAPPLPALSNLFDCDADLFCSFPELDHYGARSDVEYIGPQFALGRGDPVDWPDGDRPRLFVYLKAGFSGLEPVLAALRDCGAAVVAHVPGASRDLLRRMTSPTLRFSLAPVDIEAARTQCDLALCHGGQGTVSALLLAGKPMVVLPFTVEQVMTARRLELLGVARLVLPGSTSPLSRVIAAALADQTLRTAARAFAATHRDYDGAAAVRRAADRCLALLESLR
jgi:UDP:flavonoid glycosyltransferase YjiC (YdhE family)